MNNNTEVRINRRRFMMASTAALAAGTMALPESAEAHKRRRTIPAPNPIPGGTDISAFGLPPPLDSTIHLYTPGPAENITLPFTGVITEGPDVEPSTVTDAKFRTAYGYLIGKAKGSDGNTYDVEVDLRVFDGKYVAMNGEVNYATFALI